VLYHDYAELSEYIREYEAGWVVAPEDREAIEAVLHTIFEHPEQITERSRNAQRLVREKLTWDRTITPLDTFVRHPRMRPHDFSGARREPERALFLSMAYLSTGSWTLEEGWLT
jgi:cell division protein FtsB